MPRSGCALPPGNRIKAPSRSVRCVMSTRLVLKADSAKDLMSANPISIPAHATVNEAVALLAGRGFHAAPVVDTAGQPIGVISTGDILRHDREYTRHLERVPQFYSV